MNTSTILPIIAVFLAIATVFLMYKNVTMKS